MNTNGAFPGLFLADIAIEYPLDWIDRLATVTLNPNYISADDLSAEEFHSIKCRLLKEETNLQVLIKSQVFALVNDENISMLIRRYHASIILLIDQTAENQSMVTHALVSELYVSIIDCLNNVLSFLEIRFPVYLGGDEKKLAGKRNKFESAKLKVTCAWSIDQIGLFFRAADESRVILAKSFSQVINLICPHLSTNRKENLSPNSVRTKSYNAEEVDKEIVIQSLEKMIRKIKGY